MIIVGCFKSKGGFIPLHLDNDDHVTSLLSLGQDVEESGGRTYYVEKHPPKKSSGSKSSLLTIVKRVTYNHGNLQTGCYNKVLHGANHWINGQRGVINFSMQKKFLIISPNMDVDSTNNMLMLDFQVAITLQRVVIDIINFLHYLCVSVMENMDVDMVP